MTLEDLYALVEQKCNNCEDNIDTYSDDDDDVSSNRTEGYMDALQWVMGLIEESHSEEEL